ncbi:MAG: transcription antitermination factor NusB [Planctomycetota bacterium]
MPLDAPPQDARDAAIYAVIDAILPYPDVPPDALAKHLEALPVETKPKAVALHRAVMQRWLTLTYLLNLGVKPGTNPVEKFEAPVLACLLVGGVELLLFDEPSYAVIDEMVARCRAMNRLKATGLVNALLRRLTELISERRPDEPWTPGQDRLPDGQGGTVVLTEGVLPPTTNAVRHLAVAGGLPRPLIRRFVEEHGEDRAARIAASCVRTPGVYTAEGSSSPELWKGDDLPGWLAEDWRRRVQDPAAALAVASLFDLSRRSATAGRVATILDLCAGRGTKTRQLLATFHEATAVAWDPDQARRADLRSLRDTVGGDRIAVREPKPGERFDVVLLDVPCSNTGVSGRRPEARYRWSPQSLGTLVDLQRDILVRGLRHIADGGLLIYTTCSIDRAENQNQAVWLTGHSADIGRSTKLLREHLQLPGGSGRDATDGSYHAIIRIGAAAT